MAPFLVCQIIKYQPAILESNNRTIEFAFFALLALAIVVVVRYRQGARFEPNPTDYLILAGVIGVSFLPEHVFRDGVAATPFLKGVIALYGCELLFNHMRARWNPLTLSSMGALGIPGLRGSI